jgi:hypothetical protein
MKALRSTVTPADVTPTPSDTYIVNQPQTITMTEISFCKFMKVKGQWNLRISC